MMKKTILLIMTVIMTGFAAMALTAEELCGCRWQSKMETVPMGEEDTGMTMQAGYDLMLNIDGTGQMLAKANIIMDDGSGMGVDVYMKIQSDVKYLLLGNTLSLTMVPETIKFDLTEDDIRVRGVQDRDMENQIISGMMMNMKQLQAQMAQSAAEEPTVLKDVVVDGKKMTCTEPQKDGSVMKFTFTKKKL